MLARRYRRGMRPAVLATGIGGGLGPIVLARGIGGV